jgi:hypothetical protein
MSSNKDLSWAHLPTEQRDRSSAEMLAVTPNTPFRQNCPVTPVVVPLNTDQMVEIATQRALHDVMLHGTPPSIAPSIMSAAVAVGNFAQGSILSIPAPAVTPELTAQLAVLGAQSSGVYLTAELLAQLYANWARLAAVRQDGALKTYEDEPKLGRDWPKDPLHEAAKQVVGGMRELVPDARKAMREASEKADAPVTGRAARDAAIGGMSARKLSGYGGLR